MTIHEGQYCVLPDNTPITVKMNYTVDELQFIKTSTTSGWFEFKMACHQKFENVVPPLAVIARAVAIPYLWFS